MTVSRIHSCPFGAAWCCALVTEERGLKHVDRKTGVERGRRVSRLLVLADDGVGVALLQNFAQLLADVVQHVNLTPEKNFVAFLDRLGIGLANW